MTQDEHYMHLALMEAEKAAACGEIPVGALIVKDNTILAAAHNRREILGDATAHAEILCIREANKRLGGWRLLGCTLYVTLEPCPMCAGAILNARLGRVVFGAYDSRAGSFGSLIDLTRYPYNHRPELTGGIREEEAKALLMAFFKGKR
ncbi:MAG: tRNA adenosine(34) deaminase TadA [Clostridia bacterium]|nr:tRNA adenosine(34) deaminase TadA [Clostridia bacterium]